MQVTLGRKGDYSVRAMIALARVGGGRRKARQIAGTMEIPERYLPQIMAPLVKAGLVQATAGPDGGYALARDPASITLLEVVEIAEGPLAGEHCMLAGGPCDWGAVCPAHDTWSRAYEALAAELRQSTFAELARKDRLIEEGAFPAPGPQLHRKLVERRGVREPSG